MELSALSITNFLHSSSTDWIRFNISISNKDIHESIFLYINNYRKKYISHAQGYHSLAFVSERSTPAIQFPFSATQWPAEHVSLLSFKLNKLFQTVPINVVPTHVFLSHSSCIKFPLFSLLLFLMVCFVVFFFIL